MNIKDIIKKVANLLYKDEDVYNGSVLFDFSSYDDENYIPYIIIDDRRVLVSEFFVNKKGNIIKITDNKDNIFEFDINSMDNNSFEYFCEKSFLYNLLSDVYYETDYSWEIGDFELDFLNE